MSPGLFHYVIGNKRFLRIATIRAGNRQGVRTYKSWYGISLTYNKRDPAFLLDKSSDEIRSDSRSAQAGHIDVVYLLFQRFHFCISSDLNGFLELFHKA